MLCQAVEAGGISVLRSAARDDFARSMEDESYCVNPAGLYEMDPEDIAGLDWRANEGKAVKVLVPWLHLLPAAEYRVVFMLRDCEESRQSLEAMSGRSYRPRASRQDATRYIENKVVAALDTLRNRKDVSLLTLQYADVVADPLAAMQRVKDAGWPIDVKAAAGVVRPELYRFRRENLVVGL